MPNITLALLRAWYLGETSRIADDTTPVSSLTFAQKLERALIRAFELLPAKTAAALKQLYPTPELAAAAAAAAAVTVAGALAASWLFAAPVGLCLTVILTIVGVAATGFNCFMAAWALGEGIYKTSNATNKFELDEAAKHFADAMVYIGPDLVMAVLTRGFASEASAMRVALAAKTTAIMSSAQKAGMQVQHLEAFMKCAKDMNRLIILRDTKQVCIQWISRGFPGKPAWIKIKNNPTTGLVSFGEDIARQLFNAEGKFVRPASSTDEMSQALIGLDMGDWIVGPDMKARNKAGEIFQGVMDWDVKPGQLINRSKAKPYTGDYDLLDVIDLDNVTNVGTRADTYYGFGIDNIATTDVYDLMVRMRKYIGESRIMHGPWSLFDDVGRAGDCTLVYPDGSVVHFPAAKVRELYMTWGRPITQAVSKSN